ncbi:MAG: NRDE family protein [Woeseiaceae bacterium]|nr:NRDE family protein [Woeseiaceae bacterium]
MCLIVLAWKSHADYRLIFAANRDELHARPSAEADWWPDAPDILAGRDLEAGGTWLGMHRSGRFATVTNYREQQAPRRGLRSRGEIVSDFISGDADPLSHVASVVDGPYAGVSVLAADSDRLCYASNRGDAARALAPGVYGLSNASLDTPWSKLVRSKQALRALLDDNRVDCEKLLDILADRTQASAEEVSSDGQSVSLAKAFSAPFIVNPEYGTRCSTAVLVANSGEVEFFERRFDSAGEISGESAFTFDTRA